MNNRIINTEFTTGTVAGTRWLHTVMVAGSVATVTVTPSGCGWRMECDALTEDLAAKAIAVVAQSPKGR